MRTESKQWRIPTDIDGKLTDKMLTYYLDWSSRQADDMVFIARRTDAKVLTLLGAFLVICTPFLNLILNIKGQIHWALISCLVFDLMIIIALSGLLFPQNVVGIAYCPEDNLTKKNLENVNDDRSFMARYISLNNTKINRQQRRNNRRLKALQIILYGMILGVVLSYGAYLFLR